MYMYRTLAKIRGYGTGIVFPHTVIVLHTCVYIHAHL